MQQPRNAGHWQPADWLLQESDNFPHQIVLHDQRSKTVRLPCCFLDSSQNLRFFSQLLSCFHQEQVLHKNLIF